MKEIARLVGCSLSSVSCWTRDIELTAEQRRRLLSRNPAVNGQLVAEANRTRARERRLQFQQHRRRIAHQRHIGHIAGCMLYWAEGSRNRNTVASRTRTRRWRATS